MLSLLQNFIKFIKIFPILQYEQYEVYRKSQFIPSHMNKVNFQKKYVKSEKIC